MKHSKRFHRSTTVLAVVALGILSLAGQSSLGTAQHPPGPSTPEDRAALFDYLLEKTFERESFSPIKNERLELDIEAGMRAYRDELIAADTDEKLFYALVKLGNARKDRHLSLNPIEGGIVLDHWRPLDKLDVFIQAPIRFATDTARRAISSSLSPTLPRTSEITSDRRTSTRETGFWQSTTGLSASTSTPSSRTSDTPPWRVSGGSWPRGYPKSTTTSHRIFTAMTSRSASGAPTDPSTS